MSNIGLGGAQYVVFWWFPVDKWLLVLSYQQRYQSIKTAENLSTVGTSGETALHFLGKVSNVAGCVWQLIKGISAKGWVK